MEPLGVTVEIERGEIATLRHHLEQNLPPIAFIETGPPHWKVITNHAVVVSGIEGDTIYLNDLMFAHAPIALPVAEFDLAWINMDEF